jgi:sugar (pentulose or hexulose) kinase
LTRPSGDRCHDGSDGDVLVGVDLGTSGLKAVARSETGELLAGASVGYPTHRPEPGAAEQDPAEWLTALRMAVRDLASVVPTERWLGLGLSAMIPTLVTVDGDGVPVGAAITWEDARAEPDGEALRERIGPDELYRRTGQWVDGRYLLPMLLRLARCEPERLDRTHRLLGAKDLLVAELTGAAVTDPSTASGFGCFGLAEGDWLPDVLGVAAEVAGRSLPGLPPVRPSTHLAPVTDLAAERFGLPPGLPVAVGSADSVSAVESLGLAAGDIAYIAGTSTVILGVVDRPTPDPDHRYLVTPLARPDAWGLEMDLLATGSAVRWLAGLVGVAEPDLVAAAGDRPVLGSTGDLHFLPYLAPGEQGALWDPTLTGSLTGLTLGHDRADLARALVTGLVLESRRCVRVISGDPPRAGRLMVAGSSAADPGFRRDLSDATGLPVVAAGVSAEHSAIGGALVAARALGLATQSATPLTTGVAPDPAMAVIWDRAMARHERLRRALAGPRGAAQDD